MIEILLRCSIDSSSSLSCFLSIKDDYTQLSAVRATCRPGLFGACATLKLEIRTPRVLISETPRIGKLEAMYRFHTENSIRCRARRVAVV